MSGSAFSFRASHRPAKFPLLPVLRVTQATIYDNFIVRSPVLMSRYRNISLRRQKTRARFIFVLCFREILRRFLPILLNRPKSNLTVVNIVTAQSLWNGMTKSRRLVCHGYESAASLQIAIAIPGFATSAAARESALGRRSKCKTCLIRDIAYPKSISRWSRHLLGRSSTCSLPSDREGRAIRPSIVITVQESTRALECCLRTSFLRAVSDDYICPDLTAFVQASIYRLPTKL